MNFRLSILSVLASLTVTSCKLGSNSALREDEQGNTGLWEKCITCHKSQDMAHPDLANVEHLRVYTAWMGEKHLSSMIKRAGLKTEEEQQLRSQIEAPAASSFVPSNPWTSCRKSLSPRVKINPVQIDAESSPLAAYFKAALAKDAVFYYDVKSMPRVWQGAAAINGQASTTDIQQGVGDIFAHTITEDRQINQHMFGEMGYFSDATMEFPWLHSAGLDLSTDAGTQKFMIAAGNSQFASIKKRMPADSPDYFQVKTSNLKGPQMGWEFAPGTMFGELIFKEDGNEPLLWEVRLRMLVKRTGQKAYWKMDVLRIFDDAQGMRKEISNLCSAHQNQDCKKIQTSQASAPAKITQMLTGRAIAQREGHASSQQGPHDPFVMNSLAPQALLATASLHMVDDVSAQLYQDLFKKIPLRSVFGLPFSADAKTPGWAPFAKSADSFVPRDYLGGFLPLTMKSCMHCHDSAGKHVDTYDPPKDKTTVRPAPFDVQSRARTWYNFIPGNDSVFSFHPFNQSAVDAKTNIAGRDSIDPSVLHACFGDGGSGGGSVPNEGVGDLGGDAQPTLPLPPQPGNGGVAGANEIQNGNNEPPVSVDPGGRIRSDMR